MREGVAKVGKLIEKRNPGTLIGALLADKSGEQHGLAAGHGDRALHPALGNSRGEGRVVGIGNVTDFLLDIEDDVAVDVHPRHYAQNDPGRTIVNRVTTWLLELRTVAVPVVIGI